MPESKTSPPWWTRAVVYQIYPRSFADADGDGIGDLRGVLEHLDHLQALGVDVVWLSPIYPSPQDDNGYDISDYTDVDERFGTLADLDELIAQLHARDMKLVMDLVVNHTSDEHPWFVESRSAKDSPKRDWYWWRPPRDGGSPGTPPNNWASHFSGSAWEFDEATGEYYLHLFSRKQPDLNWENPEVRAAVQQMMRWWLDRGVDGFRMDVINFISKVPGLPDGPQPPGALFGDAGPATQNGPRIHAFLAELRREVFGGREGEFLTVGEMPGATVEEARLYTDPARGEVDMIFQFEHVELDRGPGGKWELCPLELPRLKASLARWQEGLADVGWNSLYWNNHDQPRAVSRFGDDDPAWRARSAKVLGTVLHLHRGTPYVYQGEELGEANPAFDSVEDFRDIESLNYAAAAAAAGADPELVLAALRVTSRDNARQPVDWAEASAQTGDPDSVFAHYRALIALRHSDPVVALGDFTLLAPEHPTLWAFTRHRDGVRLLVLANLSREDLELRRIEDLDASSLGLDGAELVLDTHRDPSPPCYTLRGWEAVVYRLPH